MQWFAILIALAAGAANPFQSGTNAALNKGLGQPLWATLWVYGSGMLGVAGALLVMRQPMPAHAAMEQTPWWAWTGGFISIVATSSGVLLAQRLGSGVFTGLSICASILVSLLLDHFGLVGMKQHTATPLRLLGGALMVAGVWLVSRF